MDRENDRAREYNDFSAALSKYEAELGLLGSVLAPYLKDLEESPFASWQEKQKFRLSEKERQAFQQLTDIVSNLIELKKSGISGFFDLYDRLQQIKLSAEKILQRVIHFGETTEERKNREGELAVRKEREIKNKGEVLAGRREKERERREKKRE